MNTPGEARQGHHYLAYRFDWEKADNNPWMKSQAGFAGQKDLYEGLYQWVYSGVRPDDESGG